MSGRLRALGDIQFPVCCLLLTMIDVVDFTVIDNVDAGVVCIQKIAGELPTCGQRYPTTTLYIIPKNVVNAHSC
jgi:hypothetical protein